MTINEDIFRPTTFDEYIGQERAKTLIEVMLNAAEQEDRYYPNILLTGPPGLGKTSLGRIIFEGIPHRFIDGSTVNSIWESLSSFVIIDEIHNIRPEVCDSLNLVIDSGKLIIVGCTTNPGMLPGPFRSRFQIINLLPYSIDELIQIIRNVVTRKETLNINDDLIYQIALRSRQTPRTALKYLAFVMDLMVVREVTDLTPEILQEAFDILGVDEQGLLDIDHKYLEAFPINRQPVGIQYLQALLAQDKETIEEEIEPYLLHLKLIDRTPRGRIKIFNDDADSILESFFAGTV